MTQSVYPVWWNAFEELKVESFYKKKIDTIEEIVVEALKRKEKTRKR